MKRTILVILMLVMFATPCLAQEVETDGMFSIERTEWVSLTVGIMILPFPFPVNMEERVGFYDGEVYPFRISVTKSYYVDMGLASIYMYNGQSCSRTGCSERMSFGIMQPNGVGVTTMVAVTSDRPIFSLAIAVINKADDDWTPPDVE